jgi:glucosamine--fructose-6-phosphate aminotransferase (isomerizing)
MEIADDTTDGGNGMTPPSVAERSLAEILSQPAVWRASLKQLLAQRSELEECARLLGGVEPVMTGSGTSYYCARIAAAVYTRLNGRTARGIAACDVMTFPDAILPRQTKCALVAFSRKGQNVEPIEAARYARDVLGSKVIGISCTPNSDLLAFCDATLVVPEAAETTRYMTRSFSTMLLAGELLAAVKAGDGEFEQALLELPAAAERIIQRYQATLMKMAEESNCDQYIYLGLGPYYGLAAESMLKIKEMAQTPAEAYHTIEMFHGPSHAVNNRSLITLLLSDTARDRELAIVDRIKALPSPPPVKIICEQATPEITKRADFVIELNSGLPEYARALLVMPITQLFGYYRALATGKELH